jgi:hypothetical protein
MIVSPGLDVLWTAASVENGRALEPSPPLLDADALTYHVR